MDNKTLIIASLIAVFNCSCSSVDVVKTSVDYDNGVISTQDNYVLIDVRSKVEFSEGYISGAINVPLDKVSEVLPAMFPDKKTKIYFYCSAGGRSTQAMMQMKKLGYENIKSLGSMTGAKKFLDKNERNINKYVP
ncbi:MAG: rhodanese-like domain-containing protein [Lentisphaeria bacterium]